MRITPLVGKLPSGLRDNQNVNALTSTPEFQFVQAMLAQATSCSNTNSAGSAYSDVGRCIWIDQRPQEWVSALHGHDQQQLLQAQQSF